MRLGRAVLFLGAGASVGAKRKDGSEIPDAKELGNRISKEFLSSEYANADFKTICDFAASAKSGRELQSFIHDQLGPVDKGDSKISFDVIQSGFCGGHIDPGIIERQRVGVS